MKKVIFILNILILGASFEAHAWNLSDIFYGYFWNKDRSKKEYALTGALYGGGVILSFLGVNYLINKYKICSKAKKMRVVGDKVIEAGLQKMEQRKKEKLKLVEENNQLRHWLHVKAQMLQALRKVNVSYEGFEEFSVQYKRKALVQAKKAQQNVLAQFNRDLLALARAKK